jgi:membrane protein YdbS with pleckstrin-like domain
MEQATGLILAANGKPFSDQDAARIKAQTITRELGEPYDVITHPTGGFAIRRGDSTPTQSSTDKQQDTDKKKPAENPFSQSRGITSGDSSTENPFNIQAPTSHQRDNHVTKQSPATETPSTDRDVKAEAKFRTLVLRPAWRGFWKFHLLAICGFIVGLAPTGVLRHILQLPPETVASITRYGMIPLLSFMGISGALTAIAYAVYGRYANRFTAKAELLESCYGIFARKSVRAEYAHIRSVDVDQGVIDRMLNIGTVEVSTAATADAEVIFAGILDPLAMQEEIYQRRKFEKSTRHADE